MFVRFLLPFVEELGYVKVLVLNRELCFNLLLLCRNEQAPHTISVRTLWQRQLVRLRLG